MAQKRLKVDQGNFGSNTVLLDGRFQSGSGFVKINSGANNGVGSAVNFPVAFTSAPDFTISTVGFKFSAPTSITDSAGAAAEWMTGGVSATQFTPVALSRANESQDTWVIYSWIAIGH